MSECPVTSSATVVWVRASIITHYLALPDRSTITCHPGHPSPVTRATHHLSPGPPVTCHPGHPSPVTRATHHPGHPSPVTRATHHPLPGPPITRHPGHPSPVTQATHHPLPGPPITPAAALTVAGLPPPWPSRGCGISQPAGHRGYWPGGQPATARGRVCPTSECEVAGSAVQDPGSATQQAGHGGGGPSRVAYSRQLQPATASGG